MNSSTRLSLAPSLAMRAGAGVRAPHRPDPSTGMRMAPVRRVNSSIDRGYTGRCRSQVSITGQAPSSDVTKQVRAITAAGERPFFEPRVVYLELCTVAPLCSWPLSWPRGASAPSALAHFTTRPWRTGGAVAEATSIP